MVEANDDDVTPHRSSPDADIARISGRRSDSDHDSGLAELRSELSIDDLRSRRREREFTRHAASPSRVLHGSLGARVVIWLSTGSTISGELVETGHDYACVDISGDHRWIAFGAIVAVGSPIDPASTIKRSSMIDAALIDVIEDLTLSEVSISILMTGGSRITGTPLGVGEALIMRDEHGFVVVAVDSVVAISRRGGDISSARRSI